MKYGEESYEDTLATTVINKVSEEGINTRDEKQGTIEYRYSKGRVDSTTARFDGSSHPKTRGTDWTFFDVQSC